MERAQKPLLAGDRFVLALGAPHTGALELLLLDRATGLVRRALRPVSIAAWASSSVGQALGSSFTATAERHADTAVVHWEARTYYAGGARLLHPPPGKSAAGDVYLLLSSGEVLRAEIDSASEVSRAMAPRALAEVSLPPPEMISSDTIGDTVVMTVQRLASDGTTLGRQVTRGTRGRIYVQRSGDGRTFAIVRMVPALQPRVSYSAAIYSAWSGKELGTITSPGPFGPFLVLDRSTLIGLAWEDRCSSRRTGCVSLQVVRGMSLPAGRVLYDHPLRDLEYHGPYPP